MAMFDALVRDVGDRFSLGQHAGALVRQLLGAIAGHRDGIAGFLRRFEAAGLKDSVSSWLGRSSAAPMSAAQLESVLGRDEVGRMADKAGLTPATAVPALAYLVPKVIGMLTPEGRVPATLPPEIGAYASGPSSGAAPAVEQSSSRWWLWLLLAAAVAAFAWWLFGRPETQTTTAPPQVTAPQPAVTSRLALSNVDGTLEFSGTVPDEQTRTGVLAALQRVFGPDNVSGSLDVDPRATAAAWIGKLEAALQSMKIPGVEALFDGGKISLGGLIPQADRDRLMAQFQSLFGGEVSIAALEDRTSELYRQAEERARAALARLAPGFDVADLVGALNLAAIKFETGSAVITPESRALLQTAAEAIRSAPAGTVIEVHGHTDAVGDAASNLTLSQQRADAVRAALVEYGVPADRLRAMGFGETSPTASNATAAGRFQNRRIEFVVQG